MPTGNGRVLTLTDTELRRWLGLLRQPDRLAEMDDVQPLLEAHDRLPESGGVEVGHAAADLLRDAIKRLEPAREAPREEWLTYEVLKTCFVDGAKRFQAANKLGISERQMSRERTRAIRLLKAQLETPHPDPTPHTRYRPEPVPAILGFMARPDLTQALEDALFDRRLVRVHGPPGVGKTSLVAELAEERAERTPTLWYRFRAGLNDSLEALMFEVGDYLRERRNPELAQYMAEALPRPETALATRLALKGLADSAHLMVLDDYHVVDDDPAIAGLLEEAVLRLPDLQVITIGRHRDAARDGGVSLAVPAFSLTETRELLAQLGIEAETDMVNTMHAWTEGIPHLVKLAASWLKTATPSEIAQGVESLEDREDVQEFLLENITELMGADDRAILDAASVFRGRFTDDALAFVGERTRGEVQDTSRRLVRAYVATRSRGGDVAFFHTSVRDYVYARLGVERRTTLHERAAIWYRRQEEPEEAEHHAEAVGGLQETAVGA